MHPSQHRCDLDLQGGDRPPTDDDTTEEEFPGQPVDNVSTDDELVGAQPEDDRSPEWYQSRAGTLAKFK